MTHGPEKSDSPIVPLKLANKVGRPAAESVEGRGGAEGNAGSQSSVRTQSREAVSQARDRIREAVNRNSKEKLTSCTTSVSTFYRPRSSPLSDEPHQGSTR
jgi:RNA-directed DNA polymerase